MALVLVYLESSNVTEASFVFVAFFCLYSGIFALFLRSSCGFPLQIALASFYEDGGDEDILTLPQPTPSSVSRSSASR